MSQEFGQGEVGTALLWDLGWEIHKHWSDWNHLTGLELKSFTRLEVDSGSKVESHLQRGLSRCPDAFVSYCCHNKLPQT